MPPDAQREAAELAEREADALEELGMLLDEEARAEVAAVLLVGEHAEDEVARRPYALPPSRARTAETSIATPAFMSSAPRPQISPSTSFPSNGGCVQAGRAVVTTSTWP